MAQFGIEAVPSNSTATAVDDEEVGSYSTIEKLIDERELDIARYELDKLPKPEDLGTLKPEEKYKLLRLHGKLALESADYDGASRLFLSAYTLAPDLDQAKQNQVLAYELAGDPVQAYTLARKYVADGLKSPNITSSLVRNTTSLEQLAKNTKLIDAHIETDENLNVALSHKYIQLDEAEKASEAAARALSLSPESAHAHYAVAMCAHSKALLGDWRQRTTNLQFALQHYDAAATTAASNKFTSLLPEILINRGKVKTFLGDSSATDDFRKAVKVSHKPSVYAPAAVQFFLSEQDFKNANELLDVLDRNTLESQFLAIVTECRNGEDEEKRGYIHDMAALAERQWARAVECRFHCVQWAIELEDYQLAESLVPESFEREHPFEAYTLQAHVNLEAKNEDASREKALRALNESVQSSSIDELRVLAHALIRLKEDANAIVLLDQVATPGVFNDDCKLLIDCAQRLKRHDLLLRICSELRETGEQNDRLKKLELQLLSYYALKEAFSLATSFIEASSSPSYFVAMRNFLAVRLDRLDELELDESKLRTPEQLPLEESQLVLLPYVTAGMYDSALGFLYAQLRIHFEKEHAHACYIYFFFRYSDKTGLCEPSPEIDVESAALLEYGASKEQRWIILEDDNPIPSRNEFSRKHAVSQCILGRKCGDVVELPSKIGGPQSATVREIQTRYVRAYHESIQHFCYRFPDTSVLQQVNVGGNGQFDFSAIVDSLKGRREHVDKCFSVYRDQACSIYQLAIQLGRSEYETVKELALHQDGMVKCALISPQSFSDAVEKGLPSEEIVLDISAIIALTRLDGWKYLNPEKRYLVSQGTSELVEQWIQDGKEGLGQSGGYATLDDNDQLVYTETTAEQREAHRNELQTMSDMIETHCSARSSLTLAEIEPEKRELYTEVLGFHNIESISVARDHGAVLWTDDMLIGFAGNADFSVERTWTQLALRCFVETGQLLMEEFDVVSAKLAAWKYGNVIWNAATIIGAGRVADWDSHSWPLKQCLTLVETSDTHVSDKMRIVLEFFKLLRRSDCSELVQSPIIQAILNALGHPEAVRRMLRRIDHVFMIDIPSANYLRLELEYWLRLR